MNVTTESVSYARKTEPQEAVVDGLGQVLADIYTLYLKTQNYHWNVTGPHFEALHAAFERQYTELAVAVDAVAERIRALGAPAPGSFAYFSGRTGIEEARGVPAATEMVRDLIASHETVSSRSRETLAAAERAGDVVTVDLLTQRVAAHEKTIWMLTSFLG